ncbi:four-carbon acid sugar kinase family protein [Sphingobacterium olei]|nr:four-carbon acid sugar kinase family protein [Sphingobacterium olei]
MLIIADDLTGAAEIGGIALRYNLTVDIVHRLDQNAMVDVLVLNTNTRSLATEQVVPHLESLFGDLDRTVFGFIYLKFDSALRGHIARELVFYKDYFGFESAVFCPVNPALGRVIKNGHYIVNGKWINQTSFSDDPEFPVNESQVLAILGTPEWKLVSDFSTIYVETGIVVPEIENTLQLEVLVRNISDSKLLAGSAAFFNLLLGEKFQLYQDQTEKHVVLKYPLLYVCGSAHEDNNNRIAEVNPEYVVYLDERDGIAKELVQKLEANTKAVFAVSPSLRGSAGEIRQTMAEVVAEVYDRVTIKDLVIEGGATSYEILMALGIEAMTPVQEIQPGLIKSKVKDKELFVTLKPGSYPWTNELWAF